MARSKESSVKRQKEVGKKKKREDKLQRKISKKFQAPATFEEMLEEGRHLLQPDPGIQETDRDEQ